MRNEEFRCKCGATPHVLRHSYLTHLHSSGASDKTLQTIAGHSQIGTTMNIYVHSTAEDVAQAGEKMHKIFVHNIPLRSILFTIY